MLRLSRGPIGLFGKTGPLGHVVQPRGALQEVGPGARRLYATEEMTEKQRRPRGYWKCMENQRAFMKEAADALGVRQAAEWRNVSKGHLEAVGGGGLIDRYSGSMARLLMACYPEMEWSEKQWRGRASYGHWGQQANRRAFFEQLAEERGVKSPADWKAVSAKDVKERGGSTLLARFGGSVFKALADAFPEQHLQEDHCRPHLSHGYWEDAANRRRFMEEAKAEFGVVAAQDWAKVTRENLAGMGGSGLLARYSNSFLRLLQDVYPEEQVDAASTGRKLQQGYWEERERRVAFMRDMASHFGVREAADWKTITARHFVQRGGSGLLVRYPSVTAAIQDLWVEKGADDVDVMACRKVIPRAFWQNEANVRRFVEQMGRQLHISSPADWTRVSHDQIREANGSGLLATMPLVDALRIAYPKEVWRDAAFRAKGRKVVQRHLRSQVAALLSYGAQDHTGHMSLAKRSAL